MLRLAGQRQLLDFPACKDLKLLPSHLDSWMHHKETYGETTDPEMAFTMLLKIIPEELRDDVLRRRELQEMVLPELIEYLKSQATWRRSETLVQTMLRDDDHVAPIAQLRKKKKKADQEDIASPNTNEEAEKVKALKVL